MRRPTAGPLSSEAKRATAAAVPSPALSPMLFSLQGPTMDPKVASELTLRIPHLGLRMREHSARALHFAERLLQVGMRPGGGPLPFC